MVPAHTFNAQELTIVCDNPLVALGVVIAAGVQVQPSPPLLKKRIQQAIAKVVETEEAEFEPTKKAIRNMLRPAGYKPAGRGKPASEYLRAAALKGNYPEINNLVDSNNVISLESGFPASLLDIDRTGWPLELRYGRDDEKYVFNAAGQSIALKGLICLCGASGSAHAGEPFGNPVKDSMRGKVTAQTRTVIGCIYASTEIISVSTLEKLTADFRECLVTFGGATTTSIAVVGPRQ